MDFLLSFCIGIGLSAACGYRVFVPLLGMSIASFSGNLSLPDSFAWIGTETALAAFAIATAVEVFAYYIPLVDNVLDTIAGPAAVIAGTIVMTSFASEMSPFLKWSLAIIAGGGTAGIFQGTTTLLRGSSTAVTAGLGNFTVATAESVIAITLTIMAFSIPFITAIVVFGLVFFVIKTLIKKLLMRKRL